MKTDLTKTRTGPDMYTYRPEVRLETEAVKQEVNRKRLKITYFDAVQ